MKSLIKVKKDVRPGMTIKEKGKVAALKGDTAVVMFKKNERCADCKTCRRGRNEEEMIIEARNMVNAVENDDVEVEVEIPDKSGRLVIRLGTPLIDAIIGIIIGYTIGIKSGINIYGYVLAFILGTAFFGISYYLCTKYEPYIKKSSELVPEITAVIKNE